MAERQSIIYAAVGAPGDLHAPINHLYSTLKYFFENMKEKGLIKDYTILTKPKGDEEYLMGKMSFSKCFEGDLHFLLLHNSDLERRVLHELKEYEDTMILRQKGRCDESIFDGFLVCHDPGACLGKAITNKDNLPRIEKEILAEMGFTKSLKNENVYFRLRNTPTLAIKFVNN